MSDWATCTVLDSFVKTKVGRKHQIPAKDIAEEGEFPVVDQGREFIAGYCDDSEKVIDFDLPLIIFGDHTRCFKYVDFPFVLGADGTKVLPPNKKLYDPRFYYFALLALELPSRGYNRHFKTLKERSLPLPPLPEQKKIAHILSTVQRAIEAQERIIQTTTELKKALMHKLFTEGLRNEPQKQTEIGLIPESWEVAPLSDCAVVQTGIAKGRKVKAEEAVEVPYLRVANVQDGYLDLSEMKSITIRKNEQQRFALQEGDAVLTEGGDFDKLGRGFIWHGQIDNCVHQNHVFAVRPDATRISSEFFAYQSQSPYGKSYFLSVAHKTTNLACINTTKLKAFPVLLPPHDQQQDIVHACHSIDEKIRVARSKKTQLQDLFCTLLHELMTAKIRVHKF
ncbi:MAG: restriction endonuclease subunit S [Candidatus Thiodiazotropha sp.]